MKETETRKARVDPSDGDNSCVKLRKNLEQEGPLDLARAFLFIRGDSLAGSILAGEFLLSLTRFTGQTYLDS